MSSIKPQVPKGFRDFLPAQKIFRQKVIKVIRSIFETYGFTPLETPSLEYAEPWKENTGRKGTGLFISLKTVAAAR